MSRKSSRSPTKTVAYDVAEQLRTPDEVAAYLDAWQVEAPDDAAGIARALGDITRAASVAGTGLKIPPTPARLRGPTI